MKTKLKLITMIVVLGLLLLVDWHRLFDRVMTRLFPSVTSVQDPNVVAQIDTKCKLEETDLPSVDQPWSVFSAWYTKEDNIVQNDRISCGDVDDPPVIEKFVRHWAELDELVAEIKKSPSLKARILDSLTLGATAQPEDLEALKFIKEKAEKCSPQNKDFCTEMIKRIEGTLNEVK